MPIDALVPVWKPTFAALSVDPLGTSWPTTIASYLAARVDGKMSYASPIGGPLPVFTFDQATFVSAVTPLVPVPDTVSNNTLIADAWRSAILSSVMVSFPGTFTGSPSPPNTFSAVSTTLPNPPVVTAAHAQLIIDLTTAGTAATGLLSVFPDAFFTAFSSIGYIITGLNSVLPVPGALVVNATVI